jgi:GxxExxY protein
VAVLEVGRRIATKKHEKPQEEIKGGTDVAWENINALCDVVRQTSFDIHVYLKNGHLEKVYENALAHRLRKRGLRVLQQHPLKVYDEDGTELGDYLADRFVEDCLIVELKAVKAIADEHVAQVLGYLRCARIETGLLINFGGPKLSVKKYLMTVKEG